jgi:CBS-domain-containing membrane protein
MKIYISLTSKYIRRKLNFQETYIFTVKSSTNKQKRLSFNYIRGDVYMKNLQILHCMSGKSISFKKDMPIENAVIKLLHSKEIGGPVIDERGHVIGWLSEQDCLAKMLEASYYCELVALVEDVMANTPITVKASMSIVDLAQQMLLTKPKIYPVVDEDNIFIGLITRKDVLAGMTKQLNICSPVM